ncbi:MAG: YlxR family protein [Actinomycetota bacterium]
MSADRPVRSCVACRTRRPQRDLLRVAVTPDGSVGLDTEPGRRGRGAYVCPDPACIERAVAQGAFAARLRGGAIPAGLKERLLLEAGKRKTDG